MWKQRWKQRCKRIEMEAKVEAKVQAKVGTKVETKTHQRLEQKGKKALSLTGLDRKVVDLMRQAGIQKCRATQGGKQRLKGRFHSR